MQLGPITLMDGYLTISPDAEVEHLEPEVERLFFIQRNINWWIGDVITFGEARWGDDIWQAIPEGASESMIRRFAAHSRIIKPLDRVPSASWTMHSISAKVERNLRKALLNHAVQEGMDTEEFREYLKRIVK